MLSKQELRRRRSFEISLQKSQISETTIFFNRFFNFRKYSLSTFLKTLGYLKTKREGSRKKSLTGSVMVANASKLISFVIK